MLAVIQLGFNPALGLGPLTIRWQTIGVTVALLVALALAALLLPARDDSGEPRMTLEQMLILLAAAVPGAVVGGRVVHVLDYAQAYAADPLSIIDPRVGSLSLLGAVLGGTLSAFYVSRMLRVTAAPWADLAAVPLLIALGLGKLAQLLGGAGQGVPFGGTWAVAFVGDGPWVSFAPSVPSHPSQVYEGIWLLLGIPIVLAAGGIQRTPVRVNARVAWADRARGGGWMFATAVAWFLAARFIIGFTWRDPLSVGPLNMEQFLALVILAVGGSFLWLRRGRVLRTVALVMCAAIVAACGSSTSPGPTITPSPAPIVRPTPTARSSTPSPSPTATPEDQIDRLLGRMTTDQKIGQLFMVAFYGDVASETDPAQVASNRALIGTDNVADAIARYHLGGVIYFTWAGNMVTPAQIATLSNSIQAVAAAQAPGVPLLIATDQEGGSVVRLPAGATGYPGNMALGATGATDLARSTGKQMGQELRAVGINDVLAPVGDVNVNPANPIIGLRSFGSDPSAVASMTAAMVQGFQANAGLGATVKHFPGHGDTDIDSHSQLPIINHSASTWASLDQPPFGAAIGAGVDSVMVGHLAFPALDPSRTPASLSSHVVTDVLRGQMGFNGVVITDALTMGALRDGYGDERIPVMALLAGDDILLMPQSLPVAYEAVKSAVASGEISAARLDESVRRILTLKIELGLFDAAPVSADAAAGALGTAAHRALEARDAESSVTLLANDGGVLPLSAPATSGPYLVVGPTAAPVATLAAILRGRGLIAGTYVTGVSPSTSTAHAAAARAAGYGTVIALTLDADTDPGQQRVVTGLAATGKPLITVSIGRPYDQAYYRAAINVCLYSDSTASLRALVRVIFGEIGPVGRLPVAIPSPTDTSNILYPLGFGLSY